MITDDVSEKSREVMRDEATAADAGLLVVYDSDSVNNVLSAFVGVNGLAGCNRDALFLGAARGTLLLLMLLLLLVVRLLLLVEAGVVRVTVVRASCNVLRMEDLLRNGSESSFSIAVMNR